MFDVGLSFDFGHLRGVKSAALSVAAAGIMLPFALAIALAYAMHASVAGDYPRLPFALFLATAISITAIPILGRIMVDLRMEATPIGVLTISAAAIDDAVGWIVLAMVSGLVSGGFDLSVVTWQLTMLIVFVVGSIMLVRPLADRLSTKVDWTNSSQSITLMALLILGVVVFALLTNLLGVFSVFGPFVLGACLSHRREIRTFYHRSASAFVSAFFLPVFFTYTGLRTDIGSLDASGWFWCGAILLVACAGKMGGCGLATRLSGYTWHESTAVAVMMNTRALMGLVAINVGRDLGAIPDSVFSMLVIMAIATTVMTVPILRRVVHQ
jgi:Kef-type K+ transport system membrane component KefB